MAGQEDRRGRRARRLAQRGRWGQAARAWIELAESLAASGERGACQQAWALGGDALRRDDRPAAAARALRRAIDLLDGPGDRRALARVSLAGALLDAGQLDAAELEARQASLMGGSASGAVALDVLSGAQLARGRVEDARATVQRLDEIAPPGARVAVEFRRAALDRLDGALDRARARLEGVLETLPSRLAVGGLVAAAAEELAWLDLFEARPERAAVGFERAAGLWGQVHRRSSVFRVAAGGVRAALAQGHVPLAAQLQRALEYAQDRDLRLLSVQLLVALGLARGERSSFDQAVAIAADCGARHLEGHARLLRRQAGLGAGDDARIKACLAGDLPWLDRARQR